MAVMIDFKGRQIAVKEFDCRIGTIRPKHIEPYVNLFVKVTNGCNARCLFCSNAGCESPARPFDITKFVDIVCELRERNIRINRINITGGEPSVVSPLVVRLLEACCEPELDDIHLHLNTNGLLPQSQDLMRHARWNSISMSLHHYDRAKLSELYGCRIPEEAFRFDGIDRKILNASCNLIRGYIDCAAEAHRMLDHVLDLGITRIGFVALMAVNSYCRERFVDLEELRLDEIPHVYFMKSMSRGSDCKCSNYLYNHNLKILEIYMRNYANPAYCESSLVYDGVYLRQGFHSDNIIY
jgi:molybdenum cofactor biosynthesis enzyme MoaA